VGVGRGNKILNKTRPVTVTASSFNPLPCLLLLTQLRTPYSVVALRLTHHFSSFHAQPHAQHYPTSTHSPCLSAVNSTVVATPLRATTPPSRCPRPSPPPLLLLLPALSRPLPRPVDPLDPFLTLTPTGPAFGAIPAQHSTGRKRNQRAQINRLFQFQFSFPRRPSRSGRIRQCQSQRRDSFSRLP
jgi:hypothetical protein